MPIVACVYDREARKSVQEGGGHGLRLPIMSVVSVPFGEVADAQIRGEPSKTGQHLFVRPRLVELITLDDERASGARLERQRLLRSQDLASIGGTHCPSHDAPRLAPAAAGESTAQGTSGGRPGQDGNASQAAVQ